MFEVTVLSEIPIIATV